MFLAYALGSACSSFVRYALFCVLFCVLRQMPDQCISCFICLVLSLVLCLNFRQNKAYQVRHEPDTHPRVLMDQWGLELESLESSINGVWGFDRSIPQTPNPKPRTPNPEPQAPNPKPQAPNAEARNGLSHLNRLEGQQRVGVAGLGGGRCCEAIGRVESPEFRWLACWPFEDLRNGR